MAVILLLVIAYLLVPSSPSFSYSATSPSHFLMASNVDVIASDSNSACPLDIYALIDWEFLFKVYLKGKAPLNLEATYTVKRMTDDPNIIMKFKSMNIDNKDLASDLHCAFSGGCDDIGRKVAVEPGLVVSPIVGHETPDSINHKYDLGCLKRKESKGKQVAADVLEIVCDKCRPKLLKSIKIEEP